MERAIKVDCWQQPSQSLIWHQDTTISGAIGTPVLDFGHKCIGTFPWMITRPIF